MNQVSIGQFLVLLLLSEHGFLPNTKPLHRRRLWLDFGLPEKVNSAVMNRTNRN